MEPCTKNNPKEDKVFLEISTKKSDKGSFGIWF